MNYDALTQYLWAGSNLGQVQQGQGHHQLESGPPQHLQKTKLLLVRNFLIIVVTFIILEH